MDGETDPETLRKRLTGDGGEAGDGDDSDGAGSNGESADTPLIVDIRSPEAFAREHIPESTNVPLADLPGEIDRIAEADEVVTVCPHGKASVKAARIVGAYREFDGRVVSLAGGLTAWDGPMERDEETTGDADAPF